MIDSFLGEKSLKSYTFLRETHTHSLHKKNYFPFWACPAVILLTSTSLGNQNHGRSGYSGFRYRSIRPLGFARYRTACLL
ncbi:MAG: hypothetical protein IJU92_05605, partial [Spirochaetaceae bacterium]|nr:hypothetical protein [Spirochaetaceae bacterium]